MQRRGCQQRRGAGCWPWGPHVPQSLVPVGCCKGLRKGIRDSLQLFSAGEAATGWSERLCPFEEPPKVPRPCPSLVTTLPFPSVCPSRLTSSPSLCLSSQPQSLPLPPGSVPCPLPSPPARGDGAKPPRAAAALALDLLAGQVSGTGGQQLGNPPRPL